VIAAWSGLGYNRRAVQLHQAAGLITTRHAGSVPAELGALMALPGVGQYTARAVLAFAFEQRVGVVDTNVARVLARAVAGRRLTGTEVQLQADTLVPPGHPWAWNQALLDLGATVCTARRPACGACPLGPDRPLGEPKPGGGLSPGAGLCRWAGSSGVPDPATGSAGTSRPQSRFEGSDRQGRGRLLAALAAERDRPGRGERGPIEIPPAGLAAAAGWPADPARARAAALSLAADGLVEMRPDGALRLPGSGIGHTDGYSQIGMDRLRKTLPGVPAWT
jgi:A/G-specific adenine glycosylase